MTSLAYKLHWFNNKAMFARENVREWSISQSCDEMFHQKLFDRFLSVALYVIFEILGRHPNLFYRQNIPQFLNFLKERN